MKQPQNRNRKNIHHSKSEEGHGGTETVEETTDEITEEVTDAEIESLVEQGEAKIQEPSFSVENHPVLATELLDLTSIVTDAGTQPRVNISPEVVNEYAEAITEAKTNGKENPFRRSPGVVFRDPTGRCVLADGFQRFAAHQKAGESEMMFEIREGNERDALLYSCGTNCEHGVRRTNKDKRRAVQIILDDVQWANWSDAEISRIAKVSAPMVASMRPASSTPEVKTVTRKGQTVQMNTSGIGKGKNNTPKPNGTAHASRVTSKEAPVNQLEALEGEIGHIAKMIGGKAGKEIQAQIKSGALPLTVKDIKEWDALPDIMAKRVAPLVMGGQQYKPVKAHEFLISDLKQSVIEELKLRAIGGDGGKFEYQDGPLTITVTFKEGK